MSYADTFGINDQNPGMPDIASAINALHALVTAPGDKAYMRQLTTGQTFAHNTLTVVAFNNALYDVGGLADLANNRFVIQKNGVYNVVGFIRMPSMGDQTTLDLQITLAGLTQGRDYRQASGTQSIYCWAHASFEATASQAVELYCTQTSGGDRTTAAASGTMSRFWIQEVK